MYIGNTPTTQAFTFGTDSFDGDGTTLQFTLSRSIPNVFAITVIVNNVPQNPFTNSFSVNSNILTFTEAPSTGTKNIWVFYNSYITQLIQPGVETVNTNTIVPNAVTYAKIQQVSAGKVLGRDASGAGVVQELPIAVDVNGDVKFNSGYGSVATAYGCRAWVNFNGTGTVAIRASGNVSSITDNGTGDYTVNFTTAMSDANYSIAGSALGNISQLIMSPYVTVSTTQCRVIISNTTTLADNSIVSVAIFR